MYLEFCTIFYLPLNRVRELKYKAVVSLELNHSKSLTSQANCGEGSDILCESLLYKKVGRSYPAVQHNQ